MLKGYFENSGLSAKLLQLIAAFFFMLILTLLVIKLFFQMDVREIENLKTQALAKGEPVPDEIQIKLVQISTTKIQAFLQSAEHAFKA